LLQGKKENALNAPSTIGISREMAELFFGGPELAIGKLIRFENKEDLVVTVVFENVPANSSQQFDFLRSWSDFVKQNTWVKNWGNTSPSTFIQLRSDANQAVVGAKIKDFIYRYQPKDPGFVVELHLQPYREKYLHSTFKDGKLDGGRIEYVRIFTIVAVFILLIACINFMNLATARSAKRAKEIGVRKVVGAIRTSLIAQFTCEAILVTLFSTAVAVCIANILLPAFNILSGKQLSMPVTEPLFWAFLIGLLLATALVAGSYPAFFLSSLNPIKVLKGSLKFGSGAIFFRKALVVFQFALSIILIVGTIVIYRQMKYVQAKNIGYDRENLLYIPIEGDLVKNYQVFKAKALKVPGVLTVTKMRNSPTVIEHHTGSIEWPGKNPNHTVSFADAVVGYDFVKTMNLKLKDGRDFSKEYRTDTASFLLNETAVAKIGYETAVGQNIAWGNRQGKVIGVLKDFHFSSMHQTIEPLIVRLDDNWGWGTILVRTEAGKTKEAISGLEELAKNLNPKFPFTYQFSDEEYTKLYRAEQVVSKLFNYFAFLAIFISCLGLFGLATFAAAQRTREIGIRKVLGASFNNIVAMLSKDFLSLIIISAVIAFPVSWRIMKSWLQDFAYRTNISWWIFVVAGLLALLIAFATVSFQSIKAAIANPVKSLRTE
jgi:putative ABC transport system permease protein